MDATAEAAVEAMAGATMHGRVRSRSPVETAPAKAQEAWTGEVERLVRAGVCRREAELPGRHAEEGGTDRSDRIAFVLSGRAVRRGGDVIASRLGCW